MIATSTRHEDARDLLGMRSIPAAVVVAAYSLSMVIVAVAQLRLVTSPTAVFIGLTVFIMAAIGAVLTPGDPLPPVSTMLLTLAGPVGCALILFDTPAIPLSSLLFTWVHGGGTAVLCFLNVRGRHLAPWLGLAMMVAVAAWWAHTRGLSALTAALLVGVDAAPITMSVMFAMTLRPTAKAVFTLRQHTAELVGESASQVAASDERAAQSTRLDALARPYLERIAAGAHLTDTERESCKILEAHLRDQLRAPLLTQIGVDILVFDARTRGVDVLLIDDTRPADDESPAIDNLNPAVVRRLRQAATDVLTHAADGRVVVRVSAADRPIAASVLAQAADGCISRIEIHPDGTTTIQ